MKQTLKILLLEDSAVDATLVQRQLKTAGFNFTLQVADTKAEFVNGLENFEPDLVLADHSLPQFNSAEALKIYRCRLQAQQRLAPFILVTGAVSEAFAAQCIKDGANDYILKDQLHRLPQAILDALEKCAKENKIVRDVFDTKQLLERYEYAARVAGLAVWDWDIIRNITHCDPGFETIFGHWCSESTIKNLNTAFISADDIERVVGSLSFALETTANKWCERYKYLKADGEYALVEDKAIVLRDKGGVAVRMIGEMTALDISRTENIQLHILHAAMEQFSHPVIIAEVTRGSGVLNIIYVNNMLRQITGYSEEELLGRSARVFSGAEISAQSIAQLIQALKQKQPSQLQITCYKKNATPFSAQFLCMPLTIADSENLHWLFIETGMSGSKQQIHAMEHHEFQLKRIAHIQSHLVRSPLQG